MPLEHSIRLNNLGFSDAYADYIRVRWLTQKTVSQARYRLKCEDAYIAKVSHSNIKAFEKDIRIQALKDAKDRVHYLLAAIGERRGKALLVLFDPFLPQIKYHTCYDHSNTQ